MATATAERQVPSREVTCNFSSEFFESGRMVLRKQKLLRDPQEELCFGSAYSV